MLVLLHGQGLGVGIENVLVGNQVILVSCLRMSGSGALLIFPIILNNNVICLVDFGDYVASASKNVNDSLGVILILKDYIISLSLGEISSCNGFLAVLLLALSANRGFLRSAIEEAVAN